MKIINKLSFLLLLQFAFACNEALEFQEESPLPDNQQKQKSDKAGVANIVFKSTDGGQTWQDISEGLPEPVKDDNGASRNASFTDDNGLYLTAGNEIYHSKQNSTAPFGTKKFSPTASPDTSGNTAALPLVRT